MRGAAVLVFATLGLGLGCQQEDELPPPPIGGGDGPVVPPIGGNGPGGDASGSGTRGSGTQGGGTQDGGTQDGDSGSTTASTTTVGNLALVSGRLLDGPAEITPVVCYVRLHLLDSLDPGSGLPIETLFQAPVQISGLPQPYAITTAEVDVVGPGDVVYVSAICDVDGDEVPDAVGAWYPAVPVQPVELPATEIDMPLDFVL